MKIFDLVSFTIFAAFLLSAAAIACFYLYIIWLGVYELICRL